VSFGLAIWILIHDNSDTIWQKIWGWLYSGRRIRYIWKDVRV
jgi:hypothetical protein